jgi:predicted nucleic acid-binding protein
MPADTAFWDTSAIIPLYCNQIMSPSVRRLRRRFEDPVVWWGTHVEVHSGINRLRCEGILNDVQSQTALEKWRRLHSRVRRIRPSDRVLSVGVSLTVEHNIRALDAFQLAAALVWCNERPRNRPFVCADKRLGDAASDAGFDVVSLA